MFLANDLRKFKNEKVMELSDLADVIGQGSVGPLAFNSKEDTRQILSILGKRPNIKVVYIFDEENELFASYIGNDSRYTQIPDFEPRKPMRHVFDEIASIIFIGLSILIISSIFVLFLSSKLQAYISEPLMNLANTAKLLSEKGDYSIRAKKETDDEIGFLTERFNGMLSQIQLRDDALQSAHDKAQKQAIELERELSEKKRAEKALRVSEKRYRDLFDNAPDIYIILNPDGTISDFNKRGLEILGYKMKDVVNQPLNKFICEEDIFSIDDIIHRITQYEIIPQGCEARIINKDGTDFWTSVQFSILKNEAQEIQFLRIVFRDIRERKQLRDELERAQRLETAGRIAGQIAHDFNNLLGPLAAYPALIRDDINQGLDVSDMLDEMEMAATKISDINQQLLTLGRRGHYNMTSIDVNNLIEKITDSHVFAKCRLEKKLAPNLFLIEGGSAQLLRALTNLIINGVESMDNQGTLFIETRNTYLQEKLPNYSSINPGNYIKIDISDQGSGIPEEIISKIFEPFFTTKTMDKMRGSGLGLSVVHGVISDHGGYITVDSKVDKGSTFSVYLPVSTKTQVDKRKVSTKVVGGNESILIVDDDPGQRKVVRFLLKRLGYKVEDVKSGEEAIHFVEKSDVDLLILDMVMDKIDGTETYRKILKSNPQQKAIMLSGYAMTKRVQQAIKLGAGGFVSKPVSFLELANVVRQELDRNKNGDEESAAETYAEFLNT